jgi:hypothetical protein
MNQLGGWGGSLQPCLSYLATGTEKVVVFIHRRGGFLQGFATELSAMMEMFCIICVVKYCRQQPHVASESLRCGW